MNRTVDGTMSLRVYKTGAPLVVLSPNVVQGFLCSVTRSRALQACSDSYIRPKIWWGDIVVVTAVFGLPGEIPGSQGQDY